MTAAAYKLTWFAFDVPNPRDVGSPYVPWVPHDHRREFVSLYPSHEDMDIFVKKMSDGGVGLIVQDERDKISGYAILKNFVESSQTNVTTIAYANLFHDRRAFLCILLSKIQRSLHRERVVVELARDDINTYLSAENTRGSISDIDVYEFVGFQTEEILWDAGTIRLGITLYPAHRKVPRNHAAHYARKLKIDLDVLFGRRHEGDPSAALEEWRFAIDVEMEHGLRYPIANVTSSSPFTAACIALAHITEIPDYYVRLEKMEREAKASTDMF